MYRHAGQRGREWWDRSLQSVAGWVPGTINPVAGDTCAGWGLRVAPGGVPGVHHGYELDIVETLLMARTLR
ncbi:MAG TPA: hypothetical protein VHI13_17750 [Candidatus Kapabacteria bacterium]|nr:hypothetical protein [Candidatus Kapabacteria bacterium]